MSGEQVAQTICSMSDAFFPAISKALSAAFRPKDELCSFESAVSENRLSLIPVRVLIHLSLVSTPSLAICSASVSLVTRFRGKAEPVPVILAVYSIALSACSLKNNKPFRLETIPINFGNIYERHMGVKPRMNGCKKFNGYYVFQNVEKRLFTCFNGMI